MKSESSPDRPREASSLLTRSKREDPPASSSHATRSSDFIAGSFRPFTFSSSIRLVPSIPGTSISTASAPVKRDSHPASPRLCDRCPWIESPRMKISAGPLGLASRRFFARSFRIPFAASLRVRETPRR